MGLFGTSTMFDFPQVYVQSYVKGQPCAKVPIACTEVFTNEQIRITQKISAWKFFCMKNGCKSNGNGVSNSREAKKQEKETDDSLEKLSKVET